MSIVVPDGLRNSANIAAQQAYRVVEADPEWSYGKDTAYKSPACGWVSSLMMRQMVVMGYEVQQEIRRGENLRNVDEHSYLLIEPDNLGIVADATWQQFIPVELLVPELPKVLLGDREDVIEQAKRYGVGENLLHLWDDRPVR